MPMIMLRRGILTRLPMAAGRDCLAPCFAALLHPYRFWGFLPKRCAAHPHLPALPRFALEVVKAVADEIGAEKVRSCPSACALSQALPTAPSRLAPALASTPCWRWLLTSLGRPLESSRPRVAMCLTPHPLAHPPTQPPTPPLCTDGHPSVALWRLPGRVRQPPLRLRCLPAGGVEQVSLQPRHPGCRPGPSAPGSQLCLQRGGLPEALLKAWQLPACRACCSRILRGRTPGKISVWVKLPQRLGNVAS